MKHFRSIDGVRGWLAWSVVAYHMVLLTGADQWMHVLAFTNLFGHVSVPCFIIISGFVITHLLIEKQERYVPYIARRFLRIYPVYICCLALGIIATYLHFEAFADHPWGSVVPQPDFMQEAIVGAHGPLLGWHLLAHLTLLHGLISNNLLPLSQFMFLGPAWSLSLEWQFYLLAPLVILGLRTQVGRIVLSAATVLAFMAYQKGWFGSFHDPSSLPGAGLYFACGIGSRLLYPRLPALSSYPAAAMIVAGGVAVMARPLIPFFLWMAFVVWLRVERPTDAVSKGIDRWLNSALDSRFARYIGTRSYSTYLIHEPIIHIVVYVCIKQLALGIAATMGVMLVTVPILIVAASDLLWTYVEAPAIAYGKRRFDRRAGADVERARGAQPALTRQVA